MIGGMEADSFYTVASAAITLRVKAKPGARRDGVTGVRGAELVVSVRSVAEKGKANAEIVKVIAKALGVPRGSVILKIGGASGHKVFQVPVEAAAALHEIEREGRKSP
jgi:uncharacterized protein (TIGR00251 family)